MKNFSVSGTSPKKRWPKVLLWLAVIFVVLGAAGVVTARRIYLGKLTAVNPADISEVSVAIPSGTSVQGIGQLLKEKGLVQADWAFKQYVLSKGLGDSLKAGTYSLNKAQNVEAIVVVLSGGKVATQLFTILPAQRLDQIRKAFTTKGFSEKDVDKALDPTNYPSHPALVDKPKSASLEGYLYPDSYQRTADTTPEVIVKSALDQMAKALTPDVRSGFAKSGLSVYQGIILASIVEQEIPSAPQAPKDDRRKATQVFLKRIKLGMQLGSDVTAFYGAVINGKEKLVGYDSPYNTRIHTGFTPTPIGNVTSDGLDAVAAPASTDYLYFVAGDDHKTYFSKTLAEHDANVAQHCKLLCQ